MSPARASFTALFAAFTVVSCLSCLSCKGGDRGSPLEFDDAWIRPPIGGRTITAAYCDVTNHGDVPVAITGFTSDDPGLTVEIHETTEDGGMMRMRSLTRVTIPPRTTVSFAPGGKHLMLFGFDGSADDVALQARLDGGETLPVVFARRGEQDL